MELLKSERIRTLASVTSRLAANHACPVWFGEQPDLSNPADIRIATASLVRLEGRCLAVTCNHVIQGFRELRHEQPQSVFGIGEFLIDPEASLVDCSEQFDLAVIDISTEMSRLLGSTRFHEPAIWPTPPVQQGSFVFFAGFPGVWVEQPGLAHLRFNALSSVSEVHSVAETHFYARIELEKCEITGDAGRHFEGLGGLSGAPVFTWRALHADLVGFVVEYQADYDLLFIRRSNALSATGKLSLPTNR